jgi:hypothetical protein
MLEKKQIILMVKELGGRIENADLGELFQDDKTQGDKKIGHGQFRELAALCDSADCFDEIELLVKYNTAKSKPHQSWAKECQSCNNQKFGDLIISYMKTIRDAEQNDSDVLTDLMHFFGYLYWQSRVWSMENPTQNNSHGRSFGNNQRGIAPQRNQMPNNGYGKPNPQHKGGFK